MRFAEPLLPGRLLRRYKRFLADIELEDGSQITAHTANTGKMQGLCVPGSEVFVSYHDNPKRKLAYTWELVRVGRRLVGVDPTRSNALLAEALRAGRINELQGYSQHQREVRRGGSRLDFCLSEGERQCFVEVKTATLVRGEQVLFPDGVTSRGRRHLEELLACRREGHRAVICFVAQRAGLRSVGLADHIDPSYGRVFRDVLQQGVEAIAYASTVSRRGIRLARPLGIDTASNHHLAH
jgi:sugar fermentation stimulation protein A